MKRYAALLLLAALLVAIPCQAQFLKKLEQDLLGGSGQGMIGQQQPQLLGTVSLPPGQYMMTNVQTGQAFYVAVQNGQMYLTNQAVAPNMMAPGQGMLPGQNLLAPGQGMGQGGFMPGQQQQGGMGGLINRGLGGFLKNELAPQQGAPQQIPNQ